MTGKIFGNNGILLTSSQEYKEQIVNELIRLTSVASVPVIGSVLTTPPNSGLTPDSYYIVPPGATGAWAGKTNQIAYPLIGANGQHNGDWGFWLPFTGVKVSLASGGDLFFTGTDWQNPATGSQQRAWPIAVFSLTAIDPRLEGASFPKTLTLPPFPEMVRIDKVSGLINSLSTGSAVISIRNGSTVISGLSNLNCTTTVLADQFATAGNVIDAGGRLIISFSSITNMVNVSFRIDYTENL